eukprot:scaffold12033_cov125-Isochrysis_galbana.AAC.8
MFVCVCVTFTYVCRSGVAVDCDHDQPTAGGKVARRSHAALLIPMLADGRGAVAAAPEKRASG